MDGDIARSGHHADLARQRIAAGLEHLFGEEHQAVARGLAAHQRAPPVRTLAGEHAGLVAIGDALVLPEQIADFARADADVTGRHVGELADVAIQLGHEALAEAHHFTIRLALGVEVRAALGAADGHAGQRILEDLFEPQELDDAEVHRRMKAQAALVGPQRAVEVDAKAAIDLHRPLVVLPGHAEDELPLRLADTLDDLLFGVLRMLAQHGAERFGDFAHGLVEFGFAAIAADDIVDDLVDANADLGQFDSRN